MSSGAFVGSCAAFALIMVITNGMSESPSRILLAGIAGTQLFNAMTPHNARPPPLHAAITARLMRYCQTIPSSVCGNA